MARWSISNKSFTPTATADATDLADNSYLALKGGSPTQLLEIMEVQINGLASATAPQFMELARDSQVSSGTTTAGANGRGPVALHPSSAALTLPPVAVGTAATNKPRRSNTDSMLALGMNAWGGLVRWVAAEGEEVGVLGNTASLGEVSLSAFTGGTPGLTSCHIIFEPM
jgi:hypothetical protein